MLLLDEKTEIRNTTRTIVGFNRLQSEHKNVICSDHPESASRITLIEEKLEESGLLNQCDVLTDFLDVDNQDLELTHNKEMIEKLSRTETLEQDEINALCNEYDSVFMTSASIESSKQAIGCVRELTHQIINNKASNGFAIVRPPGHHADRNKACGFCIFNNVAQAAEEAFNNGADRILIVDLDVHHGNGTQKIFYNDKRVLYFSIHRYEYGKYWPHLQEGNFDYIGEGAGIGFNANLPLNEIGCGDSDYLSILFNVLLPLATQFDPHFVIVSAGFDSCIGDPLGKMQLTPTAYSHIIYHLKSLAKGRLLLVLEGGYNHQISAIGVQKCLRVLLGYPPECLEKLEPVKESTIQSCLGLISVLRHYWSCFAYYPKKSSIRLSDWPVLDISAEFKFNPDDKPADTSNIDQKNLQTLPYGNVNFYDSNETLVFYNEGDSRHRDIEDNNHPEKPERTVKILKKVKKLDRCILRKSKRMASDEEILLAHTQEMLNDLKTTRTMSQKELDEKMENLDSIFLTNDTLDVALNSVGTLLQSVDEVYQKPAGQRNSFVIIRPPGHHASSSKSSGFCIFNNVAVAARYAQKHHGAKKVLILDWDVHHGNGTQEIFYEDNSVMYMSIHRHDKGAFYPIGEPKDSLDVGENSGVGYSVNIPLNGTSMGDFEYQTAFNKIIMPIAYQFNPDLVLISAGFDAAANDPLGEFEVSPETYALMTYQLLSLASGRVIAVLEGGYNLTSISNSALAVTEVLLNRSMTRRIWEEKEQFASESRKLKSDAVRSLREVATIQQSYWSCLAGFQVHMDPANNVAQSSSAITPDDFAGHTVVPLRDCPHLVQVAALPENGVDAFKTCNECNIAAEVWTCLTCYQSHCGRFVNEHAIHHYETSAHPMALSLADLSAWCYPCEAYVHNPILTPAKSSAHESKFGNPIEH